MKPLNQYPKHKRKKIAKIRIKWINADPARFKKIFFPNQVEKEYDCKCGKKITVVVNRYDNSNSGIGRCECGATMYVN